jgi:hypothetical protein
MKWRILQDLERDCRNAGEGTLKRPSKTMKTLFRIDGNDSEIRTGYSPSTSVQLYRYAQTFIWAPDTDELMIMRRNLEQRGCWQRKSYFTEEIRYQKEHRQIADSLVWLIMMLFNDRVSNKRVNIVTCIPIARQWLGKHITLQANALNIGRLFLGNGTINTPL